jgi:hypothetical protein
MVEMKQPKMIMKTIYGYSKDYNMGFIKRRKSGKN